MNRHCPGVVNASPARYHSATAYRLPHSKFATVDKMIEDMLSQDVIEPTDSEWNFPLILVSNLDGTMRPVIDYRELNKKTFPDSCPGVVNASPAHYHSATAYPAAIKVTMEANTETMHDLGGHFCDIVPCACGRREPITQGHKARMTSGLPQFTFPKFPQVPIYRLA